MSIWKVAGAFMSLIGITKYLNLLIRVLKAIYVILLLVFRTW